MSDRPAEAMRLDARPGPRAPALDAAAAQALAVVTLLTTGDDRDIDRAAGIVSEVLAAPTGAHDLVNGLTAVCATLLVLLEFHGALRLEDALREVGRLVAEASELP